MNKKLTQDELNNLNGGFFHEPDQRKNLNNQVVQIYLENEAVDMDATVETLIKQHPEFAQLLVSYPIINYFKDKSLNDICPTIISESLLQSLIDEATGYTRN